MMIVEKLANLKPGKILVEDVYNFQGLLLLKKNTYLTEKNLRMLKSWGISEVMVAGEDGHCIMKSRQDPRNDVDKEIEKEIKETYISGTDNPVMREIMTTAMDLLAKRKHANEKLH